MRRFLLLVGSLTLLSCAARNPLTDIPANRYVLRSELLARKNAVHATDAVSIKREDDWLTYIDDVDHFWVAYPANYPESNPMFHQGLSIERMDSPTPCTPSLTGVSQATALPDANGKAEWGKLDWMQWRNFDKAYPDALCTVPKQGCEDVDEWSYEGCQKGQGAYALCSEKDGKTVVICVSQVTDNPELAKQIFETFRWTE